MPKNGPRFPLFVAMVTILGAAEIGHGIWRVAKIRDAREVEFITRVDEGHQKLARDLEALLGEGRHHAEHLSRSVDARRSLQGDDLDGVAEFEARLLPYLVTFVRIDRVRLLDESGREKMHVFRQGGGVAAMPHSRLDTQINREVLARARVAAIGETAFSKVETDRDRVEVTPERRKVIHCSRSVVAANGAPLGYVVLTVYAEPILAAVRDFAPSPGVESFVLDAEGQSLDAMDSDSIEPATLASDERRALIRRALDDGVARDRAGNLVVAHEVANSPLLFSLVSFVPAAVRNETRAKLGGEYLWAVGSTVLVALVLVLAALFYVRMSERGFRLVESENYLEQIRRESAKYRALLDGSADMILVVDPAVGWVRECNHGARSELGIIEGETDAASILRDSDRETFRASLLRAEDQPGQIAATGEYWVKNQKGEDRLVEARFVGIELDDGPAVQVSFRDRTEQKDMERRVGTVERLSSLGLVTAGVAHEINNPLAAIANYLALLEKESADEDKRQRYVRLVRHGFDRIRAIVKDLLRFARPRESGGSTDLTEAAHRAAGLLTYAGGNADIDVCLQDLERPVFVAGEDGGIEQVILNLLLNASNAMQGKGRIVVSWRHETDRELGGPVIDLVVEDEGPGIDPDALEKIFDPFFTSGSGTGLGLSVSFGIVRAFGGRLWAENCSGRGARFVVRLPTADAEARRP